ncbi:sulfotransferase 2B1-like isoform X2 [Phyllopteryx taeniolatus]|uniref:sulfotransferase 2B1-like isoform X2 n=1 Tax=Phyllopteryx taeniolatus TaxID=161469 RepID=UPI002AD5446E|nr:sulfotransferase 2B1-like isoform X2 [Phyllopteryx taeniolatus]
MAEADLYTVYKGLLLPTLIHPPQSLTRFETFTFRPEDVVIATYPKSGGVRVHYKSSWLYDRIVFRGYERCSSFKEIVPLIMSGGDPASVETLHNWDRVPWLEEARSCSLNLDDRPSPRMFTTHFPPRAMPPSFFEVKPKVIYVMRNPKDVFTSSFHYCAMASFLVDPGPQNEFLQKFLKGEVMFGSWFDHVKAWLNYKEPIFYICYEEMVKDLKGSVARIALFLQKSLDDDVIATIAERCVFKTMKKNNMSNYSAVPKEIMDPTKSEFLRKGIAGDWKNQLTVAEVEQFDGVYTENMRDVDFKFAWD